MTSIDIFYSKDELFLPWKLYILRVIASFEVDVVPKKELKKRLECDGRVLNKNLTQLAKKGLISLYKQEGWKTYIRLTKKGKKTVLKLKRFFFTNNI